MRVRSSPAQNIAERSLDGHTFASDAADDLRPVGRGRDWRPKRHNGVTGAPARLYGRNSPHVHEIIRRQPDRSRSRSLHPPEGSRRLAAMRPAYPDSGTGRAEWPVRIERGVASDTKDRSPY